MLLIFYHTDFEMKVQYTKYTVMSILLLTTSAFLCHCTHDRPTSEPRPDVFKKESSSLEMLNAYYQNLHIMQQISSQHNILVEDFKVGYKVALQIKAPDMGLFALNFYNSEDNIVLHIVARYNWLGERNVLVLNTFQGGRWESEVRPSGFDFQPGISVTMDVDAESDGFHILQNNREIVSFPYRSGLPVTSVRRISVISEENRSAQDALLTIKFI